MNSIIGEKYFIWVLVLCNVIASALYAGVQYVVCGVVCDYIFICILLTATIMLVFSLHRFYQILSNDGYNFYKRLYHPKDRDTVRELYFKDMRKLFRNKGILIFTICFVVAFLTVMYFEKIWCEKPIVRYFFLLFILMANIVTAICIYIAFGITGKLVSWCKSIKPNIFSIHCYENRFILSIRRRVFITTSIYISSTLISTIFSKIQTGYMVIPYSVFAFILTVSIYLFPQLIINKTYADSKDKLLSDLYRQIDTEYNKVINVIPIRSNKKKKKIDSLFVLKKRIIDEKPSKYSFGNTCSFISIAVINLIPILVQLAISDSI